MAIDKFNLTLYQMPDTDFLAQNGDIKEDEYGRALYKYFCKLDKAEVFWKPHKFSERINYAMPYTKIDINPKYFPCFRKLFDYLCLIMGSTLDTNQVRVTRIDLVSDIPELPFETALSRLHVVGFRRESMNIIGGTTLYVGKSPKIRIYDKLREIQARLKRKQQAVITPYEQSILDAKKPVTRFEIALKPSALTLKHVIDNPYTMSYHFERIKFFNFKDTDSPTSIGGLPFVMSLIRREYRTALEKFRDTELETLIKDNYLQTTREWFEDFATETTDDIPF